MGVANLLNVIRGGSGEQERRLQGNCDRAARRRENKEDARPLRVGHFRDVILRGLPRYLCLLVPHVGDLWALCLRGWGQYGDAGVRWGGQFRNVFVSTFRADS